MDQSIRKKCMLFWKQKHCLALRHVLGNVESMGVEQWCCTRNHIKYFPDTLIQQMLLCLIVMVIVLFILSYFIVVSIVSFIVIVKINDVRGDLTDISAKTKNTCTTLRENFCRWTGLSPILVNSDFVLKIKRGKLGYFDPVFIIILWWKSTIVEVTQPIHQRKQNLCP